MTPPELLPVEQVDRDEASIHYRGVQEDMILAGKWDDNDHVQGEARRRLSRLRAAPAVVRPEPMEQLTPDDPHSFVPVEPSPAPVRELREALRDARNVLDAMRFGRRADLTGAVESADAALALTENTTSAGEAR